jgi:hypothetical protein
MVLKYKHKIKYKNLNYITLRLLRKGCILYPVYDLVIIYKKSRANNKKVLDKLGFYILILMSGYFFLIVVNYICGFLMVYIYITKLKIYL